MILCVGIHLGVSVSMMHCQEVGYLIKSRLEKSMFFMHEYPSYGRSPAQALWPESRLEKYVLHA